MPEEELKIPSPRQVIDFLNSKTIRFVILAVAIILLIVSGFKLIDIKKCNDKNGLYMEGGKCYIPEDEEERQKILEQGYRKTGWDTRSNLSNILKPLKIENE